LTALAATALAACGGSTPSSPPLPTIQPGPHVFTDLVEELPTDLDESGTPSPAAVAILPSWSSELVRPTPAAPGPNAQLPPDDAVVPYLATSWQRTSDGGYTFELRRGVRGATGDAFTAADVRWSLERALARAPDGPYLFALGHIDTTNPVTILNGHTVHVNVTSPSPFTLSVLSSYDLGIYDSALYRAHAVAGDPWAQQWGATHSASFGAYSVADFVPRREIVLDANPGFWRRPYYTTVVIREEPSSSGRLAALLAGTATHTRGLSWSDFGTAVMTGKANGVSASILQTGPAVVAWHLNVTSGPLASAQVREAINLGINRAELTDTAGLDGGYAQPSVLTIPAAFGQAQPTSFDPQQSRSLLNSTGQPLVSMDLFTNDVEMGGNSSLVLNYIYHDMLQIGVIVNTTFIDDSDQLLALEQSPGLQSSVDIETPLLGGPGMLLEQEANASLDPVSDAAVQRYATPALQSLLNRLGSSSGGADTAALIKQTAAAIDAQVPTINLYALPIQNVTRANVTGYAAYTQPVVYYENLHPTGAAP
jgi:peptide/nickel transport system substrate-binding protein